MIEINIRQLLWAIAGIVTTIAAVIGIPMTMCSFMFKNLKDDFKSLKDFVAAQIAAGQKDVRRRIAAGTKKHEEFRQGFKDHVKLFGEYSKQLAGLNGKMEVLISLQRSQANE